MPFQASDYAGELYYVCHKCKEGKVNFVDNPDSLSAVVSFQEKHLAICQTEPEVMKGFIFLSKFLSSGYIDVDREDMLPLPFPATDNSSEETAPGPLGLAKPSGPVGALAIQRAMRRQKYIIQENGDKLLQENGGKIQLQIDATDEEIAQVQQEIKETPAYVKFATVAPSLKDMQVSLPWTVRYSRDYRANPEAHKDFRHAITHVMKATGKLATICDDFDHKRDSEMKEKAKDYLADLVICALRAANTFPGGVIDLMDAVQKRVVAKNFTEKKELDQDG